MGDSKASQDGKVRCRGCNDDLVKSDGVVVRICEGKIEGVEDGTIDFSEPVSDESTWGYMHKRCFLLAVGDPEAITMMG